MAFQNRYTTKRADGSFKVYAWKTIRDLQNNHQKSVANDITAPSRDNILVAADEMETFLPDVAAFLRELVRDEKPLKRHVKIGKRIKIDLDGQIELY